MWSMRSCSVGSGSGLGGLCRAMMTTGSRSSSSSLSASSSSSFLGTSVASRSMAASATPMKGNLFGIAESKSKSKSRSRTAEQQLPWKMTTRMLFGTSMIRSSRVRWCSTQCSHNHHHQHQQTTNVDPHKQYQYVSLYRYATVLNPVAMRDYLFGAWEKLGILGRIYVSSEGINAQMVIPVEAYEQYKQTLTVMARDYLTGNNANIHASINEGNVCERGSAEFPFSKLNVKVRERIVQDDIPGEVKLDLTKTKSMSLKAQDWHDELEKQLKENRDNLMLLDVRNYWESKLGRFDGAIRLPVERFSETVDCLNSLFSTIDKTDEKGSKSKKLMMYCTGGIRCEKVAAYLTQEMGFPEENIRTLHGGIVAYEKYVQTTGKQSLFAGRNLQFDARLKTRNYQNEEVTEQKIEQTPEKSFQPDCDFCGTSYDNLLNCANPICDLLVNACPTCAESYNHTCSTECKEVPVEIRSKVIPVLNRVLDHAGTLRTIRSKEFYNQYFQRHLFENQEEHLNKYLEDHSTKPSAAIEKIFQNCREKHPELPWQKFEIGFLEARFLSFLVKICNAKRILELGTFVGYSTLWFAEHLPADGSVVTCENSGERAAIARENFNQHPDGKKIELIEDTALNTLKKLKEQKQQFDIIFIDADKRNYLDYFQEAVAFENGYSLLNTNGIIIFDNVLWKMDVLKPESKMMTKQGVAMKNLNEVIANDERVENVMLPVRDGITLVRLTDVEKAKRTLVNQ